MQFLLYVPLDDDQPSTSLGGTQFDFSQPWTQNEKVLIQMRFTQNLSGGPVQVSRVVNWLKANLCFQDARPTTGYFKLYVGSAGVVQGVNLTTAFQFDATPEQVQNALNALSGGFVSGQKPVTVTKAVGSYFIRAADGSQLTMALGDNMLFPFSFGNPDTQQVDGKFVTELRLTQSPAALTSLFSRVVPIAPSIAEIQVGNTVAGTQLNEVQVLTVPANFQGLYYVQRGELKSPLLRLSNTVPQIQAALQTIADSGGTFNCTQGQNQTVNIEFAGTMGGQSQALLSVVVASAPEGDLTFEMDLSKNELDKMLKASGKLQLDIPFEVTAGLQDEQDDTVERTFTLIQQNVTVRMSNIKPGVDVAQGVDFLRPYSILNYNGFNLTQLLNGQKVFDDLFGDGVRTSYPIAHNLATMTLANIFVFEAKTNGRVFAMGNPGTPLDYQATITDNNTIQIVLTSGTPPAADSLCVVVVGALSVSQFAEGLTVTEGQVDGLTADLTAFGNRVTALEAIVTPGSLFTSAASVTTTQGPTQTLRQYAEIFGTKGAAKVNTANSPFKLSPSDPISKLDPTKLPSHGGGLLPALNVTTATSVSALPGSPVVGTLYVCSAAITLPAAQSHLIQQLAIGDHFAWSGSVWYKVEQYATDTRFTGATITINTSTGVATIGTGYTPVAGQLVQLQTTGTLPTGTALATDYAMYTDGTHWYLKFVSGPDIGDIVTPTSAGTGTHTIGLSPTYAWWYPSDFDRELFFLAISDTQLLSGWQLNLLAGLEMALLYAAKDAAANLDSKGQWAFVLEWAPIVQDSALRPGFNLGSIAWNPVPLMEVPVILTSTPVVVNYGVTIKRAANGSLTALQNVNGATAGALSTPSGANMFLRGSLRRFDTEDSKPAGKGFLCVRGSSLNPQGTDGSGSGYGIASITTLTS